MGSSFLCSRVYRRASAAHERSGWPQAHGAIHSLEIVPRLRSRMTRAKPKGLTSGRRCTGGRAVGDRRPDQNLGAV
jgi:hypothetical protein